MTNTTVHKLRSAQESIYRANRTLDSLNNRHYHIKQIKRVANNKLNESKETLILIKNKLSKVRHELLKADAKLSAFKDAESLETSELASLRKKLADEKNKLHTSRSERDVWIAKVERGLADPGSISSEDIPMTTDR